MRIVLIGGGGHASDVLDTIEAYNERKPGEICAVGLVADDEINLSRFVHRGVPALGNLDVLKSIDATHYVVAIGYSEPRKTVQARISDCGLKAAVLVDLQTDLRGAPVGEGSVILSGVYVGPLTKIGAHVYISRGVLLGHDCIVEDFVSVFSGVSVSGDVRLCNGCQIGVGASIIQGITIGAGAIVGPGSVVLQNVPPGATVFGNPARIVKI